MNEFRHSPGGPADAVLTALVARPLDGFAILQSSRRRSDGRPARTAGAVYVALEALEAAGLVVADEPRPGRPRRQYRLTPLGREVLRGRRAIPVPASALPWRAVSSAIVPALPYALAAAAFALYAAISVGRHERLETGFDLGVFEQAVRSYSRLQPPVAELKGPGVDLLGDHFHPILAVLAPFYRLFPGPVTLLVAQAALLALSAVPVTRLAVRRLGPARGGGVGVAYALSWGLLDAAAFDFHENCFAVPLLALSLEGLALRRWRAAALSALPLVLVKEDLPLTLAAVGAVIALRGPRRGGTALACLGLASWAAIVFVAIPALSGGHAYTYWDDLGVHGRTARPADITGHLAAVPLQLLTSTARMRTLLLLLAPTLFLALRSPLVLVGVPTLAWRFLSSNPAYWGTDFHYSAVLMPVLFVAFADALSTLAAGHRRRHRLAADLAVPASLALTLAFCAGLPLPELSRGTGPQAAPVRELVGHLGSRQDPTAAAADGRLSVIPDGASVAASGWLIPRLTSRTTVYLFPAYPRPGLAPGWIATTAHDWEAAGAEPAELAEIGSDYRIVFQGDGAVILRRRSS